MHETVASGLPDKQLARAKGPGNGEYNFPKRCSNTCWHPDMEDPTLKEDPMRDYIPLTTLNATPRSRVTFGMHMPTRKNVIMKYLFGEARRAEADIMMRFPPHPRIVSVKEIVKVSPDVRCLIFPYFDGGDLIDAVSQCCGVDEGKALKHFMQLMEGLCHIHSHDVAHCDVKLDNLVLDAKGDLHLIDFGSAVCRSKECILACGGSSTLNYMAPEVHEGGCDLDHVDFMECDVFSAGVVLFCLLVGCFPWCEADVSDPRYKRYMDAYPDVQSLCGWDRISEHTVPMLLGMLNPDPTERWRSDRVLRYLQETHPLTQTVVVPSVQP